jgi:FtsZ-interacting cell division protein ZipA
MDITHFVFAFYVFLLVCVTIWFYARVTRGSKKKDGGAQDKEQHLFKLYQNIEDMLGGFEEYAEEAKTAIDERLKQAEALIAAARDISAAAKSQSAAASAMPKAAAVPEPEKVPEAQAESKPEPKAPAKKPALKRAPQPAQEEPALESREEAKPPQKSAKAGAGKSRQNKNEEIAQFAAQGMSKEEIARTLGISTREVSLIMQVKKIGNPEGQN